MQPTPAFQTGQTFSRRYLLLLFFFLVEQPRMRSKRLCSTFGLEAGTQPVVSCVDGKAAATCTLWPLNKARLQMSAATCMSVGRSLAPTFAVGTLSAQTSNQKMLKAPVWLDCE